MVEKKTTKTSNTTKIKGNPKKITNSKKPKSLVLEIAKEEKKETCSFNHEEKCKKGFCCRKIIHIIEFLLLIANFVLLLVVLCQIKKVNYWTELGNGGTEHFKTLESLYNTNEYKNYVEDQIYNLEATLQNYGDNTYNYEDYEDNYEDYDYEE